MNVYLTHFHRRPKKPFSLGAVCVCVLSLLVVSSGLPANAQFPNLPVAPLSLQGVGDPNIIVTFDDSGSMSLDAIPDNKSGDGTGRRLAHKWNALAYNPFFVYEAPFDPILLDGTRINSPFNAALINGFHATGGTEDLSANYRTHSRYRQGVSGGAVNYGTSGNATFDSRTATYNGNVIFPIERAYFYAFYNDLGPGNTIPSPGQTPASFARNTTAPPNCGGLTAVNDVDCYVKVTVPVGSAHEQNFANWFSFYRTRSLLTVTGANIAFFALPRNYRVTWQAINTCTAFNGTCNGWDNVSNPNVIRPFTDATHRQNFFRWLSRVPANGSTPLVAAMERAGQFYMGTGVNSPIANRPGIALDGPGTAPTNTCRPNYHVMMTDGIWNSGQGTLGERDSTPLTLPDGTAYASQAPYAGTGSGNLADVAFYYWANDLQPSITNNVLRYYADPADVSFFNARNDPATWQHMVNFTIGLGLGGVLNGSGGQPLFVPAGPNERASSGTYKGSYNALVAGTQTWPAPSDNSTNNISDLWHAALNSRGYFFSADDPSVIRRAFEEVIARISAGQTSSGQRAVSSGRTGTAGSLVFDVTYDPPTWSGTINAYNVRQDGTASTLAWTTDTTLVNNVGRTLVTWDSASQVGKSFSWTSFNAAEQGSLFNNDEDLFNWIRGDRSKEGTPYRVRQRVLGDIIGSDLVVSSKRDFGYSVLPGAAGSSYRTYVNSKQTVAFAGANDGMVHGFKANGTEAFGYVPSTVLPKLKLLANDPYIHQTLVDGPMSLWDYYSGSGWKTILVGGLGGGGKSFFGLDVTSLTTSTSGTFSSSNILFELNDADLGYTFTRPLVVRQPNGDWVVIFANGYGGASNTAQLFVRNLTTGALKKIDTGFGSSTSPNGLSSPTAYSLRTGMISGVYAGDYRGNLWRFEVDSTGNWKVANAGSPLFVATNTAGDRQPITASPTIMKHPAGGIMVLFGTGKFFETQDRTDTSVNTFYGLRDVGTVISGRSQLVQQTVTSGNSSTANQRTVSSNAVDFNTKRGWYLDLNSTDGGNATGEKVVANAILRDEFVIFNTFIPNRSTCEGIGTGFLMGINAFTGTLPDALFDENGDGVINSADLSGGKGIAGSRTIGSGSLMAPVAQVVTIDRTPTVGSGAAAGACGGNGQAPCSGGRCLPGFSAQTKNGVTTCGRPGCRAPGVIVNNNKCSLLGNAAPWTELR
jgi:type IV pilus assembly protein PilY1